MKNTDFVVKKASSPLHWLAIYRLYRRAFPWNERKPFGIILSMHRKGKTDVWYYQSKHRFAGFATTINDESLILLDYLAVIENARGRGIGSRILQHLMNHYSGKGFFVEIESEFEETPDQEERIRRKQFYLRNGMEPSHVMASVFGVKMELLCKGCCVDFNRYHAFYRDNYSPWAASNIVEAEYPRKKQP